jgi:hypothetical protein
VGAPAGQVFDSGAVERGGLFGAKCGAFVGLRFLEVESFSFVIASESVTAGLFARDGGMPSGMRGALLGASSEFLPRRQFGSMSLHRFRFCLWRRGVMHFERRGP